MDARQRDSAYVTLMERQAAARPRCAELNLIALLLDSDRRRVAYLLHCALAWRARRHSINDSQFCRPVDN